MVQQTNNPLRWWESLLFFLGRPKWAYNGHCCGCNSKGKLIDLGDGDRVCKSCWDNYVPSIEMRK